MGMWWWKSEVMVWCVSYLDVKFLVALATSKRLLSLGMLAAVMATKLVQPHECLLALRTSRGDFLVVAGF